jgi:hypothetical protein
MRKMVVAGLSLALTVGLASLAMGAGTEKTVTGALRDTFCYTVVGAHGAGHAQCALKCAQKGIPVGLVETGTSKMYILLPPKNAQSLPADVLNNMEKDVTVTGKSYSKDGVEFLTVESVK